MKLRAIAVCLVMSAMSLWSQTTPTVPPMGSGIVNRYFRTRNLMNPIGRAEASQHTTSRYTASYKDSDWAFSAGSTGGVPLNQQPWIFVKTPGTPSCANDYAVWSLAASPSAGTQANLAAFYNLYTGSASSYCPNSINQAPPTTNASGPSVLFAYAVGSTVIQTSPVASLDGTKIAVVEQGPPAKLHIITWSKQSGSPTNVTTNSIAPPSEVVIDVGDGGSGCTTGAASDFKGNPFVDYTNDILYVGDSSGRLYRINGAFKGTPTLDYCTAISTSGLGLPVWDDTQNLIYITDGTNLYGVTVGATSFTISTTVTGISATNGIKDDPIVDDSGGFLYMWTQNDGGGTPSVGMWQLPLSLASKVEVTLGPSVTTPIYDGDCNNAYWTLGPTSSTSTCYSWGNNNATSGIPTMNAVRFNSSTGVMNTTLFFSNNTKCENSTLATSASQSIYEFYDANTSSDQLFAGINLNGRLCRWSPPPSNAATAPTNTVTGYSGNSLYTFDGDTGSVDQEGSLFFGTNNKTTGVCGTNVYCFVKLKQADLSTN